MINALAYYIFEFITAVKSFMIHALGGYTINVTDSQGT